MMELSKKKKNTNIFNILLDLNTNSQCIFLLIDDSHSKKLSLFILFDIPDADVCARK